VVDVAGNTVYSIDTVAGIGGAATTSSQLAMQNATIIRLLSVKDYATILAATNPVSNVDPLWALNFRAMIYDDELWFQTPGPQQSNPLVWYRQSTAQMKGRNYKVVSAPARDLANVLWPRTLDPNFLAMNILGDIAGSGTVDIVHIQAQNDQPTAAQGYALPATTFYNFVDNAISEIRAANPNAIYTVGLAVHAADVAPFTNMQAMQTACARYAVSGNDGNGTTGGQGGATGFWMNFNGNNAAGVAAIAALAGI
jgi:hypothetical protein